MGHLLETTQKLRCDSEASAKDLIEQFRVGASSGGYTVKKAGYEYKTKKAKGEIIDEAWVVTVTQTFGSLWEE